MSEGLDEIERLARSCLRSVAASERRQLLRTIARDIRQHQAARIAAQLDPDGAAFTPRRPKKAATGGGYTVKFLYPKGAAEPRVVLMKSWVRQGALITGFDSEAGAIRSFFWDHIAKWLPVEDDERVRGGKLRRRGTVKKKVMFKRLASARYLKAGVEGDEAWVGFSGGASTIATVHQDGARDRPTKGAKPVRYARRVLLGLTPEERTMLVDRLLEQLAGA